MMQAIAMYYYVLYVCYVTEDLPLQLGGYDVYIKNTFHLTE